MNMKLVYHNVSRMTCEAY